MDMRRVVNTRKYLWAGLLNFSHRIFTPLMIVVILYAVIVVGFSSLTPWVRMYKPEINSYLNQSFKHPIEVGDIKTSWYGMYPVIKFINVRVTGIDGKPWVCDECWVGFDVLRSLLYWHIHPGLLYVDGVHFNIEQHQQHWQLQQAQLLQNTLTMQGDFATNVLKMVVQIVAYAPEKILFKNIDILIEPEHAHKVGLYQVRLLGQKKEGQYLWSVQGTLDHQSLLKFRVDMPLWNHLDIPDKGRFYVEVADLNLQKFPWIKEICQHLNITQLQGDVSFQAWMDWEHQQFSNIHTRFNGKNLLLNTPKMARKFAIPYLSANLLWKKNLNGWELAVDKLNFNVNHQNIVDDKFLLFYQGDWNNYHFYIKEFPLFVLKRLQAYLPKEILSTWVLQSQGRLKDLQLNFKDGQLDYFLSEFLDLSWPLTANMPGVKGLSGVLSWDPGSLHLEFSSPDIEVQFPKVPVLKFEHFSAVLGTRRILNQTRCDIESLVLSRKDLALTLAGEIDAPLDPMHRNFRLQGRWSAKDVESWRPYLSIWMSPSGLQNWLQHDVKRIERASGEWVLNGAAQDFPFDDGQGEFMINAFLYGVDLNFSKQWPMVKHIDAQLLVQKRVLEAKIDKAFLNEKLPIGALSLLVPDLGRNQEVLLIHGQLQATVAHMLQYLMNTPLKNRAIHWKPFQFHGNANLDLKLDIPLSVENGKILSQGRITIPLQEMDLGVFVKPLPVSNLQGYMAFNSDGITNGKFEGRIGGDKCRLDIKHHQRTEFIFKGGVELDLLKQVWGIDSTDILAGHLPLEGSILLANVKFPNMQMQWKSSLKGVKLDLPEPWSKKAKEVKPLLVNMQFKDRGVLQMDVDYMHSQWFVDLQDHLLHLKTEQPHFSGNFTYNTLTQQINVKLSKLWLDSHLFKSHNGQQSPPWAVGDLPNFHMEVDDFRWDTLTLGNLLVDAKKLKNKWQLEQLSIQAPYYGLVMEGDVLQTEKSHFKTSFSGEMKIYHLAKTLEMWGITPVANCKDVDIHFNGRWGVALNQIALKTLDGNVDVLLKKGNITHLDPQTEQKIGLGKLLSILSLQTLPRRLQLDFSDLASQGFTYDVFKGHFDLHNGMLKTIDSIMDGPVANIKISGDLNVLDRWYDLELKVYPYITASLPVVATIAGGPLAGVATWAANHLINQGMQQISGYTYQITGPWQQPVVQQVNLERKH